MNVTTMQRIDYWVGIPLLFLLSGWETMKRWLGFSKARRRKVFLFIELSEMGSAVLAYSSLVKVKEQYPAAQILFLTFERCREGVELLDFFAPKDILVIRANTLATFLLDSLRALWVLRRLRVDVVFDLELFSRCTMILSYLVGASTRVGFDRHTGEGLYRGNLLTHPVLFNCHQHMEFNFLALVTSIESDNYPLLKSNVRSDSKDLPLFYCPQSAEEEVDRLLTPLSSENKLVIFNHDPGVLPLRSWPHFSELGKMLLAWDRDIKIGIVGLESSRGQAKMLMDEISSDRVLDFTGKTANLRALLALFRRTKLLISIDSGPAHFAALTRTNSIVLFGPETPALYSPLGTNSLCLSARLACSPCFSACNHRRSMCRDNQCMYQLDAEVVMKNACAVLGK